MKITTHISRTVLAAIAFRNLTTGLAAGRGLPGDTGREPEDITVAELQAETARVMRADIESELDLWADNLVRGVVTRASAEVAAWLEGGA